MPSDEYVLGDSPLQSDVLETLTEAVNYRAWQAALAWPWMGDDPIEIGSGNGDFAETVAERGGRILASEADSHRLEQLRTRFAGSDAVGVRELAVPITEQAAHSAVLAFNVLEHIPDHVEALAAFRGLLRPGGHVVIFVPAFAFAMSRFDRAIGHQRRYTTEMLGSAMTEAGLRVERLHYVNAIGLPAWVVGMRLLRMTPQDGAVLRVWDRHVVPRMRRIEERRIPPFGQSVFCVGTRD